MSLLSLLLLLHSSDAQSQSMVYLNARTVLGAHWKNSLRQQLLVKTNREKNWLTKLFTKACSFLLITWNGRTFNNKHTTIGRTREKETKRERERGKQTFIHTLKFTCLNCAPVQFDNAWMETNIKWKPTYVFFVQKCSLFVVEHLRSVFVLWLQYFVVGFFLFSVSIHKQFWSNGFGGKKVNNEYPHAHTIISMSERNFIVICSFVCAVLCRVCFVCFMLVSLR